MLGNQQGKVGVLRLFVSTLIAVSVYGYDTVGVFVYHDAVGIHTEGTHRILEFLCAVHNFALVKLIRQMGENHSGQLHTHTDVHPVGFCVDVQILTNLLHPLTAATAYGNNTFPAVVGGVLAVDAIAVLQYLHGFYRGIEMEIHLILQLCVEIFQYDKVDVRTQMAYGGIQQI